MRITTMGVDLAKNVFQIHGADDQGRAVLRKKLRRNELMAFIALQPKCLIGIEACGGAHYWSRQFKKHGHEVKIMPAQYVKPFVKTNKNDFNDAEAICEAVRRPNMRFVPEKSVGHQDIQAVHRIRQRIIGARTALVNEVRGLLSEYGVVVSQGVDKLRKNLPEILCDEKNELTPLIREVLSELYTELSELDERIKLFDEKIKIIFKNNELCKRLSKIEGVGVLTSTAIVAAAPDPKSFKNGRQFSAWLGLVPRQNSSGGKTVLLGISKRGDKYCRMLLVHGGRSVVIAAQKKTDKRSLWVNSIEKRRGKNRAAVAVANKNARIIWKMMVSEEQYRSAI